MPLILAHGQPKSGSSFLFQIAKGAAERANGMSLRTLRKRYLADVLPENSDFVNVVTEEIVSGTLRALPHNLICVIKTHRDLDPSVRARIAAGRLMAFTSFRDPRDAALSLLEHGIARTEDRIVKVRTFSHAISAVREDWRFVPAWSACPNVIAFPFYLTAADRRCTIESLCRHIGLPHATREMMQRFGDGGDERIWMFNKGTADRFVDALSPEELAMANKRLTHEVEAYEGLARTWMRHHNRQILYLALKASRDRRLSRRNAVGAVDTALG